MNMQQNRIFLFYDALLHVDEIPDAIVERQLFLPFVSLIETLRSKLQGETYTLEDLMDDLLEATQYVKLLQAEETVEAESRLENIDSFVK